MVPAGDEITVTLKKFGLPPNIPESAVLILGTTSPAARAGGASEDPEPYSGEPAEIRIEGGNKVVMSLTSRYVNGEAAGPLFADHQYTIVFKKSAGITNPAIAGTTYAIQLSDTGGASYNYPIPLIESKVKLVPKTNAGPRGTALEITGLGLNSGDATIYLNSVDPNGGRVVATAYRLDKAYASGGIAKVTVDTTTQNFIPGTRVKTERTPTETGRPEPDLHHRCLRQGNHHWSNNRAQFEITPLIELDGDVFKRGGKVNITVSDWVYGNLQDHPGLVASQSLKSPTVATPSFGQAKYGVPFGTELAKV